MKTIGLLVAFAASAVALWPQPVEYEHGKAVMWLPKEVNITYHYPQQVCRCLQVLTHCVMLALLMLFSEYHGKPCAPSQG
jgi:hypothetical protein